MNEIAKEALARSINVSKMWIAIYHFTFLVAVLITGLAAYAVIVTGIVPAYAIPITMAGGTILLWHILHNRTTARYNEIIHMTNAIREIQ